MLRVNQQMIDLGKIPNGTPKSFKYTLTNTHTKPVNVTSLRVGCGSCTTASVDNSVIQPGESATVNVTFTPNSSGTQIKSVTVNTTDGNLTLKFSAEVI